MALCDGSKHAALVALLAAASNQCAERMRRKPPYPPRRIDWSAEICRIADEDLLEEGDANGNDADGNAPTRKMDEELLHSCGFLVKKRPGILTEIPTHVLMSFQPLEDPRNLKTTPPSPAATSRRRKPAASRSQAESTGDRRPPPMEVERGKNAHAARFERHRDARSSGGGAVEMRSIALAVASAS